MAIIAHSAQAHDWGRAPAGHIGEAALDPTPDPPLGMREGMGLHPLNGGAALAGHAGEGRRWGHFDGNCDRVYAYGAFGPLTPWEKRNTAAPPLLSDPAAIPPQWRIARGSLIWDGRRPALGPRGVSPAGARHLGSR